MAARRLLLIEPTSSLLQLRATIQCLGWDVQAATSLAQAKSLIDDEELLVGLVVLASQDAFALVELERLTASCPIEWIALVSPMRLQETAWAKLILENFYDHHTLPLDAQRLSVILGHAYGRGALKHNLNRREEWVGRYQMIGKSDRMLELYAKLDRITKVDAPVLISGESGTGKELIAHAIHQHSRRASGPFIPVNCGALPDTLIQSELFGHERGAFTGAHRRKIGSIEAAAGGVIFLDEIGDLPLELQAHLLRFLQERTIVRLGSTQRIPIDVRVVAATNVDLQQAVARGRFREDLFYRLNVLRLNVAPLRERRGDIQLLIDAFFKEFFSQKNPSVQGFSQDALRAAGDYPWPGNVRELENAVKHAMLMSENRLITPGDLGLPPPNGASNVVTLSSARSAIEKDMIRLTLRNNDNNVSRTARELGVSRVTLYRLMDRLEIDPEREARQR